MFILTFPAINKALYAFTILPDLDNLKTNVLSAFPQQQHIDKHLIPSRFALLV
jgi:hypothetical protein